MASRSKSVHFSQYSRTTRPSVRESAFGEQPETVSIERPANNQNPQDLRWGTWIMGMGLTGLGQPGGFYSAVSRVRAAMRSLEATAGYGGAADDKLDIANGFARDMAGNAATADAVNNGSLFQSVIDHIPPPMVDPDVPFAMVISALAWSDYVGRIAIGRII